MSLPRCPKKCCRSILVPRVDPLGRVHWDCPPCARVTAGYCLDCPNLITKRGRGGIGRARRCDACRVTHKAQWERDRGATPERLDKCREQMRRHRLKPGVAARRAAEAKEYRKRQGPRTDIDRTYDREKQRRLRRGEFKRPPTRAAA